MVFSEEQRIEFRQGTDLSRVLYSHEVAPHKPTNLLATAPSVLLYAASSETGDSVFALDLSGTQPKPVGKKKGGSRQGGAVGSYDMCTVGGASDQLIVAAHGVHGAHAFSTTSGRLAWRVTEQTYGWTGTLI